MTIREAISAVVSGTNLSVQDAYDAFSQIMEGAATDSQIAAFIVGLRMKGETIDEITGAVRVMREKVTAVVPAKPDFLVDTCGTGGDRSNTFNISTVAAFVAAGGGAQVAKHGNRSVSSSCGSADVLEALGVAVNLSPESMKRCLDETGIAFLFAPLLHKAMKYAANPRKEIGVRTILNILGPLTNPAMAKRQVLGAFSADLTEPLARVLANLGSEKVFVVHGMERLDEVSIAGPTQVSELAQGTVRTYTVTPADFGLPAHPLDRIKGGTAADNAAIARSVLSGAPGPHRDVVLINAAFALAASGKATTIEEGVALARQSIDSGAARQKLDQLIALTKVLALS
jgi:anthranilate phosphoribosyltransferase